MKCLVFCFAVFTIVLQQQMVQANNEITEILHAPANKLTASEIEILRPLFEELQTQYDYIHNETSKNGVEINGNADMDQDVIYENTLTAFQNLDEEHLRQQVPSLTYDTSLPSVYELISLTTASNSELTTEEMNELLDMQAIMQETLDEAQQHIDAIVERAILTETDLRLRLNKPKLATIIYKALRLLFRISARLARAAYCTYSHTPQLNASLHNINDGIDCYTDTTALIVRVQNEAVHAVTTIRENVLELAQIYKKIAAKKTLLGKLFTFMLNFSKVVNDIRETYTIATKAMNDVQNELPQGVEHSKECGANFASNLPEITETITNVTTCILFVDDTTPYYAFMQPEGNGTEIENAISMEEDDTLN